MIKILINWLAKRGHIAHPELYKDMNDYVLDRIKIRRLQCWVAIEGNSICYSSKWDRYLVFKTYKQAREYVDSKLENSSKMKIVQCYIETK